MKVFVVFDSAAAAYGLPFFMLTPAEALRGFKQAALSRDTKIGQHPADYTLFEIGTYDQISGEISMHDAKINLGTALEWASQNQGAHP